MDLFAHEPAANLLPCDGIVHYHGPVMNSDKAQDHAAALLGTVPWQHDETVIFGKRIVTARQVAWYGDAGCAYTYSGTTKHPLPWT
ncbi:MAG: methylase, partial [Verrucomicrobiaceae bacterium]|nr:methylase [Verrucomicrobiaceae bacterium]